MTNIVRIGNGQRLTPDAGSRARYNSIDRGVKTFLIVSWDHTEVNGSTGHWRPIGISDENRIWHCVLRIRRTTKQIPRAEHYEEGSLGDCQGHRIRYTTNCSRNPYA